MPQPRLRQTVRVAVGQPVRTKRGSDMASTFEGDRAALIAVHERERRHYEARTHRHVDFHREGTPDPADLVPVSINMDSLQADTPLPKNSADPSFDKRLYY